MNPVIFPMIFFYLTQLIRAQCGLAAVSTALFLPQISQMNTDGGHRYLCLSVFICGKNYSAAMAAFVDFALIDSAYMSVSARLYSCGNTFTKCLR